MFAKKSATELRKISKEAKELAEALEAREPSVELALANGVRDTSYITVRYGRVDSYSGEAMITMADGSRWRAVGHGPQGNAEWISREGWIEFIPLPPD